MRLFEYPSVPENSQDIPFSTVAILVAVILHDFTARFLSPQKNTFFRAMMLRGTPKCAFLGTMPEKALGETMVQNQVQNQARSW